MQTQDQPLSVRVLIERAGVPYAAARYEPRQALFHQGDDGGQVMYVESGRVELATVALNGKAAVCGLLGPGAFLGEEALSKCGVHPYTAMAMAQTDVLILERSHMVHLLASHREFADRFIEHSVNRTARLSADLANQLLYSCEARLARVLMDLARLEGLGARPNAVPDVTQEFIARMVGTTRSRVNHLLGKFKKLGFVEDRDGVLRLNPARLCAVSGGATGADG